MAVSQIVKTNLDGKITISDSGGSNSLEISFEDGSLTANVPGPTAQVFLDRGKFGTTPSVRAGDDQMMDGSFNAYLREFTDTTAATLFDIIHQTALSYVVTTWTSTLAATSDLPTYNITFETEVPGVSGEPTQTLFFPHCYITGSFTEGQPSTIAIAYQSFSLYPTAT